MRQKLSNYNLYGVKGMKKSIFKKGVLILLSVALASVSLAGCSESSGDLSDISNGSSEKITINVADSTVNQSVWFQYGIDKGIYDKYLDDYNVEIKVGDFESGPAINESYATGNMDFATIGCLPAVSGIANDYGYKIIAKTYETSTNTVLIAAADSDINSPEDLKGKKLGTYIGGLYHYIAMQFIAKANLTNDDVSIINTATETVTSIRAGEIDAAVLGSVAAQELIDEGTAKLVSNDPGVFTPGLLVGSEEFAEKYPEITEKFIEAFVATVKYVDGHKEDYLKYVSEITGTSTESIDRTWDELDRTDFTFTEEDYNSFDELIAFMRENELLVADNLTVDDLFDLTYARAAGIEK